MKQIILPLGFFCGLVACGGSDAAPFSNPEKGEDATARADAFFEEGGVDSGYDAYYYYYDGGDIWSPTPPASDAAADTGPQGPDPKAPVVEITSPANAQDPNNDEVLVRDEVEVLCKVIMSSALGAAPVDKTSVLIELIGSDGKQISNAAGVPTDNEGEYEAVFELNAAPAGKVSFRCSAGDTSNPPLQGFDEISSFIDKGPNIKVISPLPDTPRPLSSTTAIEFAVTAHKLNSSDKEAGVNTVELKVAGTDIDVTEDAKNPGHYLAVVDFNNQNMFPDTPSGPTSIVITATNKRSPKPATNIVSYSIIVDGKGPIIAVDSPVENSIVSGDVVLKFTIKDEGSKVDENTVVIQINDVSFNYDPLGEWNINGDQFTYRFDTRNAPGSLIQLTIDINASDELGNPSVGASLLLYLDNTPPLIDLDPPNMREMFEKDKIKYCSQSFDPVGPAAVNDGDVVPNVALFRALVEDRTNTAPGQTIHHGAQTDVNSVYLYAQKNPSVPLLIDTDKDGACDDLASDGLPNTKLTGLPPMGSPYYDVAPWSVDGGAPVEFLEPPPVPDTDVTGHSFTCGYVEKNPESKNLCTYNLSDMQRAIPTRFAGAKEPAIYAISPDSGMECTGRQWELTGLLDEGVWACVAARAKDNVGNRGISTPLRICMDDPRTVIECPVQPEGLTCTDGCTLPPTVEDLGLFVWPILFQ